MTTRKETREDGKGRMAPVRKSALGLAERSARLLDSTVFAGLLGLMVLAVIPYGTVDAWWEAIFECAVFAMTAIWILEVLLRGRWEVQRLFIVLPLVLITVFAFAQTLELPNSWLALGSGRLTPQHSLTIDRYQTLLTARKALALTLFFGLLLLHTSTSRRFRWLIRTVVGLGLGSALFAMLRQFLQSPDSQMGFALPFLFYGVGFGQFISPNLFAYLMEMVFALQVGLILGRGIRRNHILICLAIAVFIWTALVWSNSRGGILAFAIQIVFLLFFSLRWYSAHRLTFPDSRGHRWLAFMRSSRLMRVIMIVIMTITLITGVFWIGGEKFATRVSELNANQEPIDDLSRSAIWRSSWELVKHNPVTGVGFGAYFLAIPEYQKGAGRIKLEQAHNDYLDLAANGGAVAVGLAGWFVLLLILRMRHTLRSTDSFRRAAALGAAAGILSVGVHSLVDFGLQITGIAVVFAALATIAVADSRVESVRKRKSRMDAVSRENEISTGSGV